MQFGRKSFISEQIIQTVLDSLIYSTSQSPDLSHLKHLFLVEKIALDPKTPDSEQKLLYIIQTILTDNIALQLKNARFRFEFTSESVETFAAAKQALFRDSQKNSNELLSWNILYYLYVNVDLGITVDVIADIIGLTPRTVRRYRQYGVEMLTQVVWQLEDKTRREFYRTLFRKRLDPIQEHYTGRKREINHVVNSLKKQQYHIVYVYGEIGIGKSTFIKVILRQLLDIIEVNDLLWLDRCINSDAVMLQLKKHFSITSPDVSMHYVLSIFQSILIFEDADDLLVSDDLHTILKDCENAIIFLSGRSNYNFPVNTLKIHLQPLEDSDSALLINQLSHNSIPSPDLETLISAAQGNPRRVLEIFNRYITTGLVISLESFFPSLAPEEHTLLMFIPENRGLTPEDYTILSTALGIRPENSDHLFSYSILQKVENRIYGSPQYHIEKFMAQINASVERLLPFLVTLTEGATVSKHILTNYLEYIDVQKQAQIVSLFWRDGVYSDDKVAWHLILISLGAHVSDAWIALALGISYKYFNDLPHSVSYLKNAIESSGLNGDFNIQVEATLELSRVYRLLGRYKQSLHYLTIADHVLHNYLTSKQVVYLLLEKAQHALDLHQLSYALSLVSPLDSEDALIIQCECHFQLGNYIECQKLCDNVLDQFDLSDVKLGMLHNLLGKCYQYAHPDLAKGHYNLALEYFSRSFSLRQLSRTQINLAILLIYIEDIGEANNLLNEAYEIASKTHDLIGIRTIEKNKSHIHRLIISQYE